MNETVTYQWSKQVARAAVEAFNRRTVGRTWLIGACGVLFLVAGAILWEKQDSLGILTCLLGGFMGLIALRAYVNSRRLVRDVGRLMDDPTMTVLLTDESITISSSNAHRTTEWSRLTRVTESNGFLLLYSGKLLVANLPVNAFSTEQVEFMKMKTKR